MEKSKNPFEEWYSDRNIGHLPYQIKKMIREDPMFQTAFEDLIKLKCWDAWDAAIKYAQENARLQYKCKLSGAEIPVPF